MMLMRDYDTIAAHFVDLRCMDKEEVKPFLLGNSLCSNDATAQRRLQSANRKVAIHNQDKGKHKEKVQIIRERLQTCCWGVRAATPKTS